MPLLSLLSPHSVDCRMTGNDRGEGDGLAHWHVWIALQHDGDGLGNRVVGMLRELPSQARHRQESHKIIVGVRPRLDVSILSLDVCDSMRPVPTICSQLAGRSDPPRFPRRRSPERRKLGGRCDSAAVSPFFR